MAYLLIELHTGRMNGMFPDEMDAVRIAGDLERQDDSSQWAIFECKQWELEERYFGKAFPPKELTQHSKVVKL